jgi:hypothetical protein
MVEGEKATSLKGGDNLRGGKAPSLFTPLSSQENIRVVQCTGLERGRGEVFTWQPDPNNTHKYIYVKIVCARPLKA